MYCQRCPSTDEDFRLITEMCCFDGRIDYSIGNNMNFFSFFPFPGARFKQPVAAADDFGDDITPCGRQLFN